VPRQSVRHSPKESESHFGFDSTQAFFDSDQVVLCEEDDYTTDRNTTFESSPETEIDMIEFQKQEIWDFGASLSILDPTNTEVLMTIRL
jgi:hypothetical protein